VPSLRYTVGLQRRALDLPRLGNLDAVLRLAAPGSSLEFLSTISRMC
jgi:hypothetical protein